MKFIRALYLIAALSASSTGMMAQTQSSGYFLHTITKGQSLYSIASMYNVTTGDIVKMNPGGFTRIVPDPEDEGIQRNDDRNRFFFGQAGKDHTGSYRKRIGEGCVEY